MSADCVCLFSGECCAVTAAEIMTCEEWSNVTMELEECRRHPEQTVCLSPVSCSTQRLATAPGSVCAFLCVSLGRGFLKVADGPLKSDRWIQTTGVCVLFNPNLKPNWIFALVMTGLVSCRQLPCRDSLQSTLCWEMNWYDGRCCRRTHEHKRIRDLTEAQSFL